MILNAKRIHSSFNFKEISPQELNKCLQKFYFRQEKATTADVRSLRVPRPRGGEVNTTTSHRHWLEVNNCYLLNRTVEQA